MGTIGEVRTSAKILQSLSKKTLCHTFDIATLRDSSKAIDLASKTLTADSK